MSKRQFKTESKRILDLMINSIYTHREIFLREIISNASDAIDKLCYISLTDDSVKMKREDFKITVSFDKDARTVTVTDNGVGMTEEELENNLGVIARSGSLQFKKDTEDSEDVSDIIGQFGVGFYSVFMVADKVEVVTRKLGTAETYKFTSGGDGSYTIE
ncbi:MAG: ATP-binding protein, partial [Oscillospiraceae bacterium]|nr:ATP-binding protein [Oscillospiraceae bacterium]